MGSLIKGSLQYFIDLDKLFNLKIVIVIEDLKSHSKLISLIKLIEKYYNFVMTMWMLLLLVFFIYIIFLEA